MGIQINGNTNNINAGIGSLSIEDLNELDIVGVATASNFKTGTSNLHSTGLNIFDLDVDGQTNLDHVSVSGVTTTTGNITIDGLHSGASPRMLNIGSGNNILRIYENSSQAPQIYTQGDLVLTGATTQIRSKSGSNQLEASFHATNGVKLYHNNNEKLFVNDSGVNITGICTATGILETTGSELKITGAEPRLTFTDTDNNPDFQIWANAQKFQIYDSTDSATRIIIDSSGNIGMNTTTASDSTGNCRAYTFTRTDNNGQVRIILKNGQTGFGNGAGYHQGIDGVNAFIENRSEGGYLDFTTKHGGSTTTKLRIKSDGYFAIGNTHGAKKIHISFSGNQKVLIDPNYNNNSGGSSNSEANANNVVDSVLIRTSFGDNAASQTNAGHKWGIKFQGYNGNDFTQNISKIAAVYAVSEDEAGGYNRNVGLTFHTSPYNTTHREAMRINTNGAVTKPYHPAFAARLGNQIDLTTAGGTDCVFNIQEFDNSGGYNTSNGRYTVPVTGKYYFGVQIYAGFNGAGVRVLHSHFRVNGVSVAQTDMFGGASNHGGTFYHPNAVGHMFRSLNKNDYVTWNIGGFSHTGGSAVLYAGTGCRFFGHLVT